eukprot:8366226-Alexandrium_andersonii.AAC.1
MLRSVHSRRQSRRRAGPARCHPPRRTGRVLGEGWTPSSRRRLARPGRALLNDAGRSPRTRAWGLGGRMP